MGDLLLPPAFESRSERKPLVVIPLARDEHCIDMVCENGETVTFVARRQVGMYPHLKC